MKQVGSFISREKDWESPGRLQAGDEAESNQVK